MKHIAPKELSRQNTNDHHAPDIEDEISLLNGKNYTRNDGPV